MQVPSILQGELLKRLLQGAPPRRIVSKLRPCGHVLHNIACAQVSGTQIRLPPLIGTSRLLCRRVLSERTKPQRGPDKQ